MTLADIFDRYTAGSRGFVNAVQKHCAFDITATEIERLALNAKDLASEPAEQARMFDFHYCNADWWTDEEISRAWR